MATSDDDHTPLLLLPVLGVRTGLSVVEQLTTNDILNKKVVVQQKEVPMLPVLGVRTGLSVGTASDFAVVATHE